MDTVDWKSGKVQGAVYDVNQDIIKVCSKARFVFCKRKQIFLAPSSNSSLKYWKK